MDSFEYVTQLLQNDSIELIREEIKYIENPILLHNIALYYNWDDGFDLPNWIINNDKCELGTALMLFYDAEGYILLDKSNKNIVNLDNEWITFTNNLFNKLLNNAFQVKKVSYQPELTKVQKYKLKKANPNLPEMFLNGVKSKE